MSIRPTRRGLAAGAVAAGATVVAFLYGGQSLFAVALPLAAALAATRLATGRLRRPDAVRRAPREATVGDSRTVHVHLEEVRWPTRVEDTLGDGLRGDATVRCAPESNGGSYDVDVVERGVHALGPLYVTVSDPLGLWQRTFRDGQTARLVAFPPTHAVDLGRLFGGRVGRTDSREQFDGVREYERGDPLRDVNWRASAKRPGDLVVTTYAGTGSTDEVTVAADPNGGDADAVAAAAGSVAVALLEAGADVGLRTPEGSVRPGSGERHRSRLLTALAQLEGGPAAGNYPTDADVVVRGAGDGVDVEVGGTTRSYAALAGRSRPWENAFQP